MLTKGEIKTINYNNNTGTVRVPLFETSDSNDQVIIDAIFVIPPGIFNGYRPGDIVEVGFENSSLTPAVILGRLYLGANIENQKTPNGTICGDQLRISKYAELPVSTKLLSEKSDKVADSETNVASFKSIVDLIIEINKLKTRISELEGKLTELEEVKLPELTESKVPELEGKISELDGRITELESKLPELG